MKNLLLSLVILAGTNLSAAPSFNDMRSHIIKYEGWRDSVYICAAGHKTVGGGTNLESRGLQNKYSVGQKVNESLLNKWLKEDLYKAENIARQQFKSFDKHPDKVQILLVSLSYNMGQGGIKKFKDFTAAINNKDYDKAARELKDSRWFKQTGLRGKAYVKMLENV